MKLGVVILALAACGARVAPPPSTVAPPTRPRAVSPAPAPPVPVAHVAPPIAAPVPPAACVLADAPSGWPHDAGEICDLPDQIIVAKATRGVPVVTPRRSIAKVTGTVTVIARPGGRRDVQPIAAGSSSTDECGGEGGGHAGCSEQGGTSIASRALHDKLLWLGVYRNYALATPKTDERRVCRDADAQPWVALCSTAKRFAVVDVSPHDGCSTLGISIYDGPGGEPSLREDAHAEITSPGPRILEQTWLYRSASVLLRFDVARGGGVLYVGDDREPCLAVVHR